MKKLIYQGYILTNSEGLTDTWKLIISEQTRVGSLFELRRQINFFQQLGVLPPMKGPFSSPRDKNKTFSKKPHKAKPKQRLRP